MIEYEGKKIYPNSKFLFSGYCAITLFGDIYTSMSEYMIISHLNSGIQNNIVTRMINHESIHIMQGISFCKWKWLSWIIFYILYLWYWILGLFKYGLDSYSHIPFEREAYENEEDFTYTRGTTKWKDYR